MDFKFIIIVLFISIGSCQIAFCQSKSKEQAKGHFSGVTLGTGGPKHVFNNAILEKQYDVLERSKELLPEGYKILGDSKDVNFKKNQNIIFGNLNDDKHTDFAGLISNGKSFVIIAILSDSLNNLKMLGLSDTLPLSLINERTKVSKRANRVLHVVKDKILVDFETEKFNLSIGLLYSSKTDDLEIVDAEIMIHESNTMPNGKIIKIDYLYKRNTVVAKLGTNKTGLVSQIRDEPIPMKDLKYDWILSYIQ